jgi:hypothetical protein
VSGVALADLGFSAFALAVTQGMAVADLGFAATATGIVVRHGVAVAGLGTLTAHIDGPITVTGTALANLGGLAASATGDRSRLPRFVLRPPTYVENLWTHDRLFSRYKLTRGTTLLVLDGVVTEQTYPHQEALEQYDFVYLGGFDHRITSFEAGLLIAAGYGEFVSPLR